MKHPETGREMNNGKRRANAVLFDRIGRRREMERQYELQPGFLDTPSYTASQGGTVFRVLRPRA